MTEEKIVYIPKKKCQKPSFKMRRNGSLGFNKAADREFMRDAKFVSVEFFPSKQKLTIRADEEGPVRLTKYPEGGGYISLTGLQKEVGWETAGTADVCYTRDGNEVSLDLSPLFPDSSEVPTNKVGGPDRK